MVFNLQPSYVTPIVYVLQSAIEVKVGWDGFSALTIDFRQYYFFKILTFDLISFISLHYRRYWSDTPCSSYIKVQD